MDIEFLKKIDSNFRVKREKTGQFFSNRKKKPKSQEKEEKSKHKIDIKV
ncbi:MAG: hypothetical protein HY879_00730 [Deltaproteobacteria bacterium]|nr:hypothetical protein [Deltaproteobacteria bacterium]